MLEQDCSWNLRPCRGPTLEYPAPEELNPMEGIHIGAVCGEPKPMRRTHVRVGEECEEWPETMRDVVITAPIPHLTEQL